jgi:hypothetical protein
MGAPTPSLAADRRQDHSGGSLTRYLGNLYRTLEAGWGPVQVGIELRRSLTPPVVPCTEYSSLKAPARARWHDSGQLGVSARMVRTTLVPATSSPASGAPEVAVTLPLQVERVYSFAMIQLPASYQEYLVGKDPSFVDMVRPVLMQSAADKLHGVRVLFIPKGHQAHLDDTIPYGTIVEDID